MLLIITIQMLIMICIADTYGGISFYISVFNVCHGFDMSVIMWRILPIIVLVSIF